MIVIWLVKKDSYEYFLIKLLELHNEIIKRSFLSSYSVTNVICVMTVNLLSV